MTLTIQNTHFLLTVSSRGAEIISLKNLKTGEPLLWDGEKSVWDWNAPQCFPFCGKAKDGYFIIDGKRYEFTSGHGFVREYQHTLIHADETSMEWEFVLSAETAQRFPYAFSLKTRYELTEAGVIFTSTVTNKDTKPIYFSFGSHTSLWTVRSPENKIEDFVIEFEKEEDFHCLRSQGAGFEKIKLTPEIYPAFAGGNKRTIPLSKAGFGAGIILNGLSSRWAGLRNTKTGSLIKIACAGFENLVLWQNINGEPQFVCIEPWNGITDAVEADHLFEKKPYIQTLDTGRSVTYDQSLFIS